MAEQSCIAGYKGLITETMYKPQEDYAFLNNVKAKEFQYNPNFRREPEGPFIQEYYQTYEADKPYSNAIFAPVLAQPENVNRQCNPFVAYPFGVPQKYEHEKCTKCKGNKKCCKKKRSRKSKSDKPCDGITGSVLKLDCAYRSCVSSKAPSVIKHELSLHSTNSVFNVVECESVLSKSTELTYQNHFEEVHDPSNEPCPYYQCNVEMHEMCDSNECDTCSQFDKDFIDHKAEQKITDAKSVGYSYCDNTAEIKNSTFERKKKDNSVAEADSVSNALTDDKNIYNTFESLPHSHPVSVNDTPREKEKICIKLNSSNIKGYSNVFSAEDIMATEEKKRMGKKGSVVRERDAEHKPMLKSSNAQRRKKSGAHSVEGGKKERGSKREMKSPVEFIQLPPEKSDKMKSKIEKAQIVEKEPEKISSKPIKHVKISDDVLVVHSSASQKETKEHAEHGKASKKKKSLNTQKMNYVPSLTKETGKVESYSRMCKQILTEEKVPGRKNSGNNNKIVVTSEEDLFGSNSPRYTFTKSRLRYTDSNKKDFKRKHKKDEGEMNPNLLASPRLHQGHHSSVSSNRGSFASKASSAVSTPSKKEPAKPKRETVVPIQEKENPTESKEEVIPTPPKVVASASKTNITSSRRTIQQKTHTAAKNPARRDKGALSDKKETQKRVSIVEHAENAPMSKRLSKGHSQGSLKNENPQMSKPILRRRSIDVSKGKNQGVNKRVPTGTVANIYASKKNVPLSKKGASGVHLKKTAEAPISKRQSISGDVKHTTKAKQAAPKKVDAGKGKAPGTSDNEKEETSAQSKVKLSRSESKLHSAKNEVVPLKKPEGRVLLKRDSGKLKVKGGVKPTESDISGKKKVKDAAKTKKRVSTSKDAMSVPLNRNVIKGKMKSKKKQVYENILSITKNIKHLESNQEDNKKKEE